MTKVLNLVASNNFDNRMNDDTEDRRILLIQASRIIFLSSILLVALVFQASQGRFISLDVWVPFYSLLFISFVLNSIFINFFSELKKWKAWINGAIFGFDAVFVTVLIYFTGTSQSVFLFLYLINIILCGLIFQRNGALLLALWTSTLFSTLLIIGPTVNGQNLYFAVGLNNIAFFAVAFLGGLLSEQINFMGIELVERQKDIDALKDLNEIIVDNMATGLITTQLDGVITQVNEAAKKILDDTNISGYSIFKLFPALTDKFNLSQLLNNEKTSQRFEIDYKNHLGEKTLIEIMIAGLWDRDQKALGYVLTFQDLTQIKKLENAIRQQEKLAAIGQLAAGIAHEIRNPLASISGSIQLLTGSYSTEEDQKLMRIVLKEIDRLNDLISEFLDYVRPQARIEDPININNLLNETIDFVKNDNRFKEKNIEFQIELSAGRLIYGHKDKLRQAFLNIIINAIQSMDKSEKRKLIIQTKDLDLIQRVRVVVQDTGCGIDKSHLHRIFEPFHTTKSGGTGLGLAITHKILESHNAIVEVDSQIGEGTSFILEFESPDSFKDHPREKIKIA